MRFSWGTERAQKAQEKMVKLVWWRSQRVTLRAQQKSRLAEPEDESTLRQDDKQADKRETFIKHVPNQLHLASAGTPAPNGERQMPDKIDAAKPGRVQAFAQRSTKSLLSLGTRYYYKLLKHNVMIRSGP